MDSSTMVRPSRIHYLVLFATTLVAVNMYVDRACISQVRTNIGIDLQLTPKQLDWVMSAFFWSYALAQIPAAMFSTRFGLTLGLTTFLVLWSSFTALTGLAGTFAILILSRLFVGITEAGAYPTAAALNRNWFPLTWRGKANGIVAFGGRLGWALSQLLTPWLITLPFLAHYGGWRAVLVIYGLFGIIIAIFFRWVVRDRPSGHPWLDKNTSTNSNEIIVAEKGYSVPFRQLLTVPNLWLAGAVMFFSNVGWAFLITNLPSYLEANYQVAPEEKGFLSSIPAWVSCLGLLFGGFVTDRMAKRFGVKWGRSLPVFCMAMIAAFAYWGCIAMSSALSVVLLLSLMALASDFFNPSIWSFSQDIGGTGTGSCLAFINMCGNLGAACSPIFLGTLRDEMGWDEVFIAGGCCYAIAATAGLLMDARKTIQLSQHPMKL